MSLISLPPGYSLTLTQEACEAEAARLHEAIRAFNNATSPHHLAARAPGAVQPLRVFIHDPAGELAGGLTGSLYWEWLEIHDLWLRADLRGQGAGRELMRLAEAEAARQGCRRAHLQTFSFQARGFYEKLGFRVVGELVDYPPGSAFYWMRKDFDAEAAAP